MFSFFFTLLFFLFFFWVLSRLWITYRMFSNMRRKIHEASQEYNAYRAESYKKTNTRQSYQHTPLRQATKREEEQQEKDISHRVRIIDEKTDKDKE